MSFSAGFARGAATYEAAQRTQLERDRLSESTRRWKIENQRAAEKHRMNKEAVQRERAKEDRQRKYREYTALRDDMMSDPDLLNEDGTLNEEAAASNPAVLKVMERFSNEPEFREYMNKGKQHDKDLGRVGYIPAGNGYVATTVDATDAEGNTQTRPITVNRTDRPDDPVETFRLADFDRIMTQVYGADTEDAQTLGSIGAEVSALRGSDTPEPQGLAAAQTTPAGQPAPTAAPAPAAQPPATDVPAPVTEPVGAPDVAEEAPPPAPTPDVAPTPEGTLSEQAAAYQESIAGPSLADVGKKIISKAAGVVGDFRDKQAMSRIGSMLDIKDRSGTQFRNNPMQAVDDYVRIHDKLEPEERKAAMEHLKPQLEKRIEKLDEKIDHSAVMQSKNPLLGDKASGYSIRHKRMVAERNRIKAALDPATQEQPTVTVENIAAVATPEKVEAKLTEVPEPTVAETDVALDEVSRPTKKSVRSGRPDNRQVLAAMRLAKKGYITKEMVARYARTGKMLDSENDEFQIVNLGEGNVIGVNKKTLATTVIAGSMDGMREGLDFKDLRKYQKQTMDHINKAFGATGKNAEQGSRRAREFTDALGKELGLTEEGIALLSESKINSLLNDWEFVQARNAQTNWLGNPKHPRASLEDMQVQVPPGVRRLLIEGGHLTEEEMKEMTPKEINDVGKTIANQLGASSGGSQSGAGNF